MRARDIPAALDQAIREHFPDDVANAITSKSDAWGAAVRSVQYAVDTPGELDQLIKEIAAQVDDRLADWLVSSAAAPAAWLAKQIGDF